MRPVSTPRWVRACGVLVGGVLLAPQVCALQYRWHASLGPSVAQTGLYAPWQLVRWGLWWGWPFVRPAMALTGVLVGVGLVLVWRQPARRRSDAQFATRRMLRRQGLFRGRGVVLGKVGRRILRQTGPHHVLCVAATQTGKTAAVVIPTLLEWRESVCIHDPKDELYQVTAGWRRTFSRIVRLRPTSPDTDQYNPLDAIRWGTPEEARDAQLLGNMLADPDGDLRRRATGATLHFLELAELFWTGLLLYGLYSRTGTSLAGLHHEANVRQSFPQLLAAMRQYQRRAAIAQAVRAAEELADREGSGLTSTVRRALAVFVDPRIAYATARSSFTWRDLRSRPTPLSLYLSIPFGDQDRLRVLSRILVRQVLDVSTQHKTGHCQRLLLMLDEVPGLHYLPVLSEGLDFLAGYGVQVCAVTPSLNRLTALYGPHHNFSEGCKYVLVFGQYDEAVAARFSRRTGQQLEARHREMVGGRGIQRQHSTSTEQVEAPLLSPTQLMTLRPDDAVLLIGNAAPVRVQKAWYWHVRRWRHRALHPAP